MQKLGGSNGTSAGATAHLIAACFIGDWKAIASWNTKLQSIALLVFDGIGSDPHFHFAQRWYFFFSSCS